MPEEVRTLYKDLMQVWCIETCSPRLRPQWSEENKTLGQCTITSFLVQDLFGGKVYGVPLPEGGFHCFCVVDMDVNDAENYSTDFRSVICFGTARVVEDEEEYYKALEDLTIKFSGDVHTHEEIVRQIDIERAQCGVTAIDVEFITGKEAIELVRERRGEPRR